MDNLDVNGIDDIPNKQSSKKENKKTTIILIVSVAIVVLALIAGIFFAIMNGNEKSEGTVKSKGKKSSYWISGNSLEPFDLYFLQLENEKQNKVYSPLSIKYALEMLEEGTTGESKEQISKIIGNYEAKKYINSENMSFANAMFIKDTYKDIINNNYLNTLKSKYDADVQYDSFATPDVVNSWVNNKTLGLINNLFQDISSQNFLLINSLAIDMEWNEKFILYPIRGVGEKYFHEDFSWSGDKDVVSNYFKDVPENVSGMEVIASFNKYDIVNTLGEENIRKTVKTEFEKYLEETPGYQISNDISYLVDTTNLSEEEMMEIYLDQYIKDINSNYKREKKTTEFSFYVDDTVKVFAKDLKEYNGTTLQYVSIMPTTESLDSYINNMKASDINDIISNLKELKLENFKEGVVTKIRGFIPKFKFEYQLDLVGDLKKLGITNVFEKGKAKLENLSSDKSLYINEAVHKSNIELTQDGIKASAATPAGGYGAAGGFDYLYDVPVEEIDLTFDKPYMFIIRDKETKEVWFTGTVYNPLLYSEDTTKNGFTIYKYRDWHQR